MKVIVVLRPWHRYFIFGLLKVYNVNENGKESNDIFFSKYFRPGNDVRLFYFSILPEYIFRINMLNL